MADTFPTDVVGTYSDCNNLRSYGMRQIRHPGSYKATVHAKDNTVNRATLCTVTPKNPVCAEGKSVTQSVRAVHTTVTRAQIGSLRGCETAMEAKKRAHDRYQRANCLSLMNQVGQG